MKNLNGVNVIAVHAHPDDEAIWTGGMLSDLAMRGANVLVVTCTLGEQGEVIGEPYANLVADKADQLGGFRIRELQKSLKTLGVRGTFLGGAGCWRDSGMAGDPANQHPRAFMNAGDEAVEQLKSIFLTHPPHLIITYGPDGGYGHPDHIKAHEITHRAVEQRNLVTPILWAVTDRRRFDEGVAVITAPTTAGWRMPQPNEIACVTSSDIEVRLSDAALAAKVQAMKAHATQLGDDAIGAIEGLRAQPATQFRGFVYHWLEPQFHELVGGHQAGDSGADDRDFLAVTLSRNRAQACRMLQPVIEGEWKIRAENGDGFLAVVRVPVVLVH